MYDSFTTTELTMLQDVLFRAVEEAYWIINVEDSDPGCFERYHPVHRELAHLYIEAGEELLARLDQPVNTG